MKILKVFHCLIIRAMISCAVLSPSACTHVNSTESATGCDISITVLPPHQTDCWGISCIEDTLLCYAFERLHDSLFRVSFYHSTDDGEEWTPRGFLDFDSFTEILGFNTNSQAASLTVGEYNQDFSAYRHRVYVSSDGCRNWDLVKEGSGRIQGVCLYNDSTISLLQADSLSCQILMSGDLGKQWSSIQRDLPIKYPHQIILDDENTIYYDYQSVIRQSIVNGMIDTVFISDKKYGVTKILSRNNTIAINEEWRDIVLIHENDTIQFDTKRWKSRDIFPVYINAQDSIVYLTVRNLSMNNPRIGTYAIFNKGEDIFLLCDGNIEFADENKVYIIIKDSQSQTYKLKRITLHKTGLRSNHSPHCDTQH